jgi:hypothetical protein
MAGLSLPLKMAGTRQNAQAQPTAGKLSSVSRNANVTLGTGVLAQRQSLVQGLVSDPAKVEVRQPGGSSNPERATKPEDAKTAVAPKDQQPIAADGASPVAATLTQVPAIEIRSKTETPVSSLSVNQPDLTTPGAMSHSSKAESRAVAASAGSVTEGSQPVPPARPAEMHSTGQAESGLPGSKSIPAQDSNGTEAKPSGVDGRPVAAATEVRDSTPGAAAPAGRMNTEALARGPDMNHALTATTAAQTTPIQATNDGAGLDTGRESGAQGNPLPAGEPNQANPGLSGRGSASVHSVKRTQHAMGASEVRTGPVQPQFDAGLGDATAMGRDPAVGREPNPAPGGAAPAEPVLRETFAALDSDVSPGAPTWTHSSARQAEAGFQDPALGWIGVRADRNGGGVHAALVPGSVEAAAELGSHLEGLNAYLAAQHTPVESLRMAAPEGSFSNYGAGQAADQGAGQGMGTNQGTGQGEHPGAGQNTQQQAYADANSGGAIHGSERAPMAAASSQPLQVDSAAQPQRSGGVYISVVA